MNQFYNLIRLPMVGMALAVSSTIFAETVQVDDFYYDIDPASSTAVLARNAAYSSMTDVNIPGTITVDGTDYTVTSIAQQAFQECAVERLTIGEGVTEIAKWAFYGCASLEDIKLPSTLTSVLGSAFSKCSEVKTLVLPDNLTDIDSYGFGNMTSLVELTLPVNMKVLSNNAFNNCSSLYTIHFNDGLESIEGNAFYGCGMTKITLPDGLKTIGTGAFSNCTKLVTMELPASLTDIGPQAFYKCGSLSKISLPENLKSLGMGAFYECTSLGAVTLPQSISFIDSNCFYGCSALESIEIPESITVLSSGMFYHCSSLSDVKLHDGITEIGSSAFYGCSSLKLIDLPKHLKKISKSMFNRAGLIDIVIPDEVTTIEDNAFYLCESLETLFISENVDSIGDVILLGCTKLQDIGVSELNPVYADISGVLVNKDETRLIAYPAGRTEVYEMPETITEIDGYVFNSNPNISGIVFSKNLKTIGMSQFYGATGLSDIYFPDALEYLGDMAFFFNSSIKSIRLPNNDLIIGNNALSATGISKLVFPEGITTIGITEDNAFSIMGSCSSMEWMSIPSTIKTMSPLGSGCGNMSTFYCFAVEPPVLKGRNVVDITAEVKVPKGSAEAYAAAWSTLYPNLTYDDVLPVGAEISVEDGSATLAWVAYSDDIYTATPVRYDVRLSKGSEVIVEDAITGDKVMKGDMSYTFNNLSADDTYTYELKGYNDEDQVTIFYTGNINMASSGIEGVVESVNGEIVAREYYGLSGQKVVTPQNGALYIVKTIYADGTVSTAKQIVK